MIRFTLNGKPQELNAPETAPLLWVLREDLGLVGTKFGCGRGLCGACTVHVNGQPTRSCILPISAVAGQDVRTIEAIGKDKLHPVQAAWIEHNVPQCGYCQTGQIMVTIGFLEAQTQAVTEDELLAAVSLNICRCGTYHKLREAAVAAAKHMGKLR